MVQLERMVMEVSTEGGWMEQERETGEPATNSLSVTVATTSGLGTERETKILASQCEIYHHTMSMKTH